jgi:hypothetical protein
VGARVVFEPILGEQGNETIYGMIFSPLTFFQKKKKKSKVERIFTIPLFILKPNFFYMKTVHTSLVVTTGINIL